MTDIKKPHLSAKDFVAAAIVEMEKEYVKPERSKLTHYWLAEKLGIPNHIAFVVLDKIACRKILCRRIPNGSIHWDNEMVELGVILDKIIGNHQVEEKKPKHKLQLVISE